MIRPLTPADLAWVVRLTRRRRAALAPHAPRFWNPAADATERHRDFLGSLLAAPEVVGVRTDHGFLIALERSDCWLVDDMVVWPDAAWPTEGVALLRHVLDSCGPIRFVAPAFETARLAAATQVGLVPAETWWHRDLDPTPGGGASDQDREVVVPGAAARLVTAPPVYDPDGPVLLVTAVASAAALHAVEAAAERRGAGVSVVSQAPGDDRLMALLDSAGYRLTTLFLAPAP